MSTTTTETPLTDAAELRFYKSVWNPNEKVQFEGDCIVRSDFARTLERELTQSRARCEEMRKALEEIEKGEGRFSRDPLTHAANTIEDMQEIARTALAAGKEEGR